MKKKCLTCGKFLVRKPNARDIHWKNQKYCSVKCTWVPKTQEIKDKISLSKKKNPVRYWQGKIRTDMLGHKWNLGKKQSEEHKNKISSGIIAFYDKNGRKKYKRYVHVRDKKYKLWRENVFQRDNWTCQGCEKRGCYLEAHHIKSWSHYPKLRFSISNGLTLCKDCHKLTDNYKSKAKKV